MRTVAGNENEPQRAAAESTPLLSSRETQVLLAWLHADSKNVVAAQLFIALGTVNTHLSRIRDKYAAAGRPAPTKASLVARALQDGLIGIDDL
ncbi:LuxR C-terminal-related transcriptional regulator [Nocardia brasiliensis]|uniref:LuxR C-terminal-related transcriptional regulator n=1 Tax=Nocardia brasiliensis TaxID=37326 RepID=UPI0024572672|nr:LuxR C-terminal-related transcriptional regulator [Nocardia brasiliensis]